MLLALRVRRAVQIVYDQGCLEVRQSVLSSDEEKEAKTSAKVVRGGEAKEGSDGEADDSVGLAGIGHSSPAQRHAAAAKTERQRQGVRQPETNTSKWYCTRSIAASPHANIMPLGAPLMPPPPAPPRGCPSAACCASRKLSAKDSCNASMYESKETGMLAVEAEM